MAVIDSTCSAKPHQRGGLESPLVITFDKDQRALAAQAFEQLKRDGLIRSTLSELVDPENWCEITDAGRQALAHGALDEPGRGPVGNQPASCRGPSRRLVCPLIRPAGLASLGGTLRA